MTQQWWYWNENTTEETINTSAQIKKKKNQNSFKTQLIKKENIFRFECSNSSYFKKNSIHAYHLVL